MTICPGLALFTFVTLQIILPKLFNFERRGLDDEIVFQGNFDGSATAVMKNPVQQVVTRGTTVASQPPGPSIIQNQTQPITPPVPPAPNIVPAVNPSHSPSVSQRPDNSNVFDLSRAITQNQNLTKMMQRTKNVIPDASLQAKLKGS